MLDTGLVDEADLSILTTFYTNINTLTLDDAIANLEQDVQHASLNSFKSEKFEYLANVVQLLQEEDPNLFLENSGRSNADCAAALARLALAFASLVAACNPAGQRQQLG